MAGSGERGPLINGIRLFDFPALAKVRVTECRQHGHLMGRNTDYCVNCGAPWFFRRADHSGSKELS